MSLIRQGSRFILIGLVQLVVDWAVFVGATALGVPTVPANVLGRVCGMLLGFWLNGRYTFAADGDHRLGWARFARFLALWLLLSGDAPAPAAPMLLAADQISEGQYFGYPGRKFRYIAPEYLTEVNGHPVVPDSLSWIHCEIFETKEMGDHVLLFARVADFGYGRLKEPPLIYSSRHGWRVANDKARTPGESPRDALLARVAAAGFDASAAGSDEED